MKKTTKKKTNGEMLGHYDFSQGVRGKYADRYAEGTNVILLEPDLAKIFTDSASVNRALRALVEIAGKTVGKASA